MALIGRHLLAEHFDILFAFFGFMVQKLCNFKVGNIFCLLNIFQKITPKRFSPGLVLTREAKPHWQVGQGHGGSQVSGDLSGHVGTSERRHVRARWRRCRARGQERVGPMEPTRHGLLGGGDAARFGSPE